MTSCCKISLIGIQDSKNKIFLSTKLKPSYNNHRVEMLIDFARETS